MEDKFPVLGFYVLCKYGVCVHIQGLVRKRNHLSQAKLLPLVFHVGLVNVFGLIYSFTGARNCKTFVTARIYFWQAGLL